MRAYGATTGRAGAVTAVTALAWMALGGGGQGAAWGRLITFGGLVPGGSTMSYTEAGYTFDSDVAIFAGSNFGPVTTAPVMFPSSIGAKFHMTSPRPFDLRSMDLGPLSSSSGPQTVTFTGTLADGGGTVSQTFTTSGAFGLQTFDFGPAFRRLSSVAWSPVSSMLDNVVATHGPVMTFVGLAPGSTGHTSYTENGFRLDTGTSGDIFSGSSAAVTTASPYAFPSNIGTSFRFTSADGKPFDLFGIDMAPLNGSVGPRTVAFTGTLAGGGTVTQSFTTGGAVALAPFVFGSEFTNLVSVDFTPGSVNFDNIEAGAFVPEPSSAVVLGAAIGVAGLRSRRRRVS
jgi:hypothetical protein